MSKKLLMQSNILCRQCQNRQGHVELKDRRYWFYCPCCFYSAPISLAFYRNAQKNKQTSGREINSKQIDCTGDAKEADIQNADRVSNQSNIKVDEIQDAQRSLFDGI